MIEHTYEKITGFFNFIEFYREQVAKARDGFHFVELGVLEGKSTSFMATEIANSGKDIRFDAIDLWPDHDPTTLSSVGSETEVNARKNLSHLTGYCNIIKSDSAAASSLYEDESLDFIFIDASHEYAPVSKDLNSWFPKIKKTGIFSGHDRSREGVRAAITEFHKNNQSLTYKKVEGDVWAFIR